MIYAVEEAQNKVVFLIEQSIEKYFDAFSSEYLFQRYLLTGNIKFRSLNKA